MRSRRAVAPSAAHEEEAAPGHADREDGMSSVDRGGEERVRWLAGRAAALRSEIVLRAWQGAVHGIIEHPVRGERLGRALELAGKDYGSSTEYMKKMNPCLAVCSWIGRQVPPLIFENQEIEASWDYANFQ